MTNPVHLLSVAALLLASFLVGAVVGTLARFIALRFGRKPAAVVAAPVEASPAAPPLVAAPVIAPLPVAPTPVTPSPADVPVPDFAATMIALANEAPPAAFVEATKPAPAATVEIRPVPALAPLPPVEPAAMQPAHVAGETTSGVLVAAPLDEPAAPDVAPVAPDEQRSAEVIRFPSAAEPEALEEAEPVVAVDVADAAPAVEPVVVEAGADSEAAAAEAHEDKFFFVGTEAASVPVAPAEPEAVIAGTAVSTGAAEEPAPEVIEAPAEPSAPIGQADATPVEPSAPAEPEPVVAALEPVDEDAAMRAIEGNWTPRRTPPKRPVRPVAEPEGANQAVAASARAVIAARRTAEAVVAEVAEVKVEAGRPVGLDAPRDGRKDELTHIIGVLPVIETALNALGIYHFDQMGELSDENIRWIENHLGVPGRIGRELWREQARELSAVLKPRRVAEN